MSRKRVQSLNPTRRCLVVGCTGMIGRRVVDELLHRGCEVHGAARFADPRVRAVLADRGVVTHPFDVTTGKPAKLPAVDLVFLECWDPAHPERTWATNFTGIARVAERYAGRATIINGATGSVYAAGTPDPQKETDLPQPKGEYALARFAQEVYITHVCAQAGSHAMHLRYFHGNDEARGWVARLARRIVRGESLGRTPDARIQVIAVEDIVRCTVDAAEFATNPAGVVNICHPRIWTVRELAKTIRASLDRGRVRFDVRHGGEEESLTGDAAKMLSLFGAPRVSFEEIIGRAAKAAG